MRLGRVRARQHDRARPLDVGERGGRRARAGDGAERGGGGGVTDARAAVHVVRAEADAEELLEQIRGLVRRARGGERAERIRAVRAVDRVEALGQERERRFPGDRREAVAATEQRAHQPVGRALPGVRVAPLRAEVAAVHRGVGHALDPHHAAGGAPDLDLAADAAVAAGAARAPLGRRLLAAVAIRDRRRRADVHARAARDAGALAEALGAEAERCRGAPALDVPDERALHVGADRDAAPAEHAALRVEAEQRMARVGRRRRAAARDAERVHQALDLAARRVGAQAGRALDESTRAWRAAARAGARSPW